jgi:hypothetical protein
MAVAVAVGTMAKYHYLYEEVQEEVREATRTTAAWFHDNDDNGNTNDREEKRREDTYLKDNDES